MNSSVPHVGRRDHRLMTHRVARGGPMSQVVGEVATSPSISSNRIPDASIQSGHLVALAEDSLMLCSLHEERRVFERGVLPAVVEMQMGVDDHRHVDRREVVSGEGVRDGAVDDAELAEDLVGAAASGVDEDGAELLVEDDVSRAPATGFAAHVQMPEVEAFDLHRQPARRPHRRIRLNG